MPTGTRLAHQLEQQTPSLKQVDTTSPDEESAAGTALALGILII